MNATTVAVDLAKTVYASAQEWEPWLDRMATKGELFVQFWLKPGEQPAFFDLSHDPPADPIPVKLRLFL